MDKKTAVSGVLDGQGPAFCICYGKIAVAQAAVLVYGNEDAVIRQVGGFIKEIISQLPALCTFYDEKNVAFVGSDHAGFFAGDDQPDRSFTLVRIGGFRGREGEKQVFQGKDAENTIKNQGNKDGRNADLPFSSFLEEEEKGGDDSCAEKDTDQFIKHEKPPVVYMDRF